MRETQLARMGAQGFVMIALCLCACLQDFDKFRVQEDGGGGVGGMGGDLSSTTTTTSATGGMGGEPSTTTTTTAGGMGGEGGTGGSDPCSPTQKLCEGECVQVNDPDFGCSAEDDACTPCAFDQASAICEAEQCALGTCDADFEDCDSDPLTGCEASLLDDVDACGGCLSPCGSITAASCNMGVCEGPCGPIPPSGLFVCWVYDTLPVPPNQFVGLAGGTADPDQGETIEEKFLDPWCVNPNMGEPFVLCDLGPAEPNWNIQFRGGLHIAPSSGTITGTWDCSTDSCGGQVYVYEDGTEIGSMISDVVTGVITVIPHFNPPGLRNVRVTIP